MWQCFISIYMIDLTKLFIITNPQMCSFLILSAQTEGLSAGSVFQQFTCLLSGMDAPWSASSADGDPPGAFETIWSRRVSSINLHLVHEGFNHVTKYIWSHSLTVVIFCTGYPTLLDRQCECQLPEAIQSPCCDFGKSGRLDATADIACRSHANVCPVKTSEEIHFHQ